jgi:hypothetical protein
VNANTALAFTAALFSLGLTLAVIFRKQRSVANWCFSAGMTALAIESIFGGLSVGATEPEVGAFWQSLATVPKSFLPGSGHALASHPGSYRAVLTLAAAVAAFVICGVISSAN